MDLVFKALAHATRRRICDALRDRPLTTGQLAGFFPELDRCTVMQHLKVLERAGLVVVARKGREVAIAADSQSTFGDTRLTSTYDARYNKIFQLDDSFIGISGSAAHDLVFQSALSKLKNRDFSSRAAVFDTFRKLHPKLKEDFFLKPDEEENDPYESSQMTVLIASRWPGAGNPAARRCPSAACISWKAPFRPTR